MRAIFAGIRTAAVISIDVATHAEFIAAGRGVEELMMVGMSLKDTDMILRGAIPAALSVMLTKACFEILRRKIVRKTAEGSTSLSRNIQKFLCSFAKQAK